VCLAKLLSNLPKTMHWILSTHSSTSKNVSWPHFSWPTLYVPQLLALLHWAVVDLPIGGAWSQSPVWEDDTAISLALSVSLKVLESIQVTWLTETTTQAFWMQHWWPIGFLTPDRAAEVISAVSVELSTSVSMLEGRIDCWSSSSSVDAADAKKAKGASNWAL